MQPLFTRWSGAVLGFVVGAADTLILRSIEPGFQLWVGAYFTASFVALGFFLGLTLEIRVRERAAADRIAEQTRRLADAELRVAHADKLASLGQLAGTMAHELRNPLAIIRSTVQNLDETLEPRDTEAKRTCRFVLEEIDRLSRVTASIVRFARPLSPQKTRIPAKELFDRIGDLANRLLASRSVTLVTRPIDPGIELEVDPDLVAQAILGLVDNAAHFSEPGGKVEIGSISEPGEVVLFVEDSGPGVPPELRQRLFEPFFTTRETGTGLGLAIVAEISKVHGGQALACDRKGGGARFELRIPRADAKELAA
jgi:signal transduction histidine kinase